MPLPSLATTERVKLAATLLNTLTAALVTVGIFTPLALSLTTPDPLPEAKVQLLIGMAVICIICAAILHSTAQGLLAVKLRNSDDE